MKSYNVVEAEDKFFCVELEQDGFFTKDTNRWPFQSYEFAKCCADLFNKFERDAQPKFSLTDYSGNLSVTGPSYQFAPVGFDSGWKCELFGCGESIVLYPKPGKVPNWFWRKMQYLILGHEWKRTK